MVQILKIHPVNFDDMEKGNLREVPKQETLKTKQISRQPSFHQERITSLRPTSSCPSLSAELVEAVLHDGQYRFTSETANEVAMWCGLVSFLVLGAVLIIVGLFLALTS